jgi:lipopolysaccharide transport system permease protein
MQHPLSATADLPARADAPPAGHAIEAAPPPGELSPAAMAETIIAPTKGWIGVNWAELFRTRELLYFLIWRDIKVRYKQTVLGVAWVVLQPLFNMILFTIVFGSAAGFNERLGPEWGSKYAVFVFAALLPWQLFATALNGGGMSLLAQTNLLTKIYFPRLYVPTAVVGGALLDLGISLIFVIGLMAWFHVAPSPAIVLLPLLLVLTIACALGAAYLVAALTITYRDFRFLIPFISQVWLFASFVAFPPSIFGQLGPKTRLLLALNPMYGIIAAWRKVILGGAPDSITGWSPLYLVSSIVITAGLLLLGMFYFRRTERRFADIA